METWPPVTQAADPAFDIDIVPFEINGSLDESAALACLDSILMSRVAPASGSPDVALDTTRRAWPQDPARRQLDRADLNAIDLEGIIHQANTGDRRHLVTFPPFENEMALLIHVAHVALPVEALTQQVDDHLHLSEISGLGCLYYVDEPRDCGLELRRHLIHRIKLVEGVRDCVLDVYIPYTGST